MTTTDRPAPARLAPVRRRVVAARRALAVAAGAGFVAMLLLVRASHLGSESGGSADTTSASDPATATSAATGDDELDGNGDLGGASISPGSGETPQVETRVS